MTNCSDVYHSEKKIDRIEERLGSLESTLKSIATSLSRGNLSSLPTPSHEVSFRARDESPLEEDTTPAFEGESSLTAQSVFATEYLSSAVGDGSFTQSQDMNAALQSLRSLVSRQNIKSAVYAPRFRSRKGQATFSPTSLKLPPLDAVMDCMRKGEGTSIPMSAEYVANAIRRTIQHVHHHVLSIPRFQEAS